MTKYEHFVWTSMVYPSDFHQKIKEIDSEHKLVQFFRKGIVFVIAVYSESEKFINELYNVMIKDCYGSFMFKGTIMIDLPKCLKMVQSINEMCENGLSIKHYYPWFIRMSTCFRTMDYEKPKQYLGFRRADYINTQTKKLHHSYLFATTDGDLIKPLHLDNLCELVDKRIRGWCSKKKKKPYRRGFTKSIRYEVFKRDSFRCVFCGATNKETTLHIDHLIPVSQSGTDELDNLQTLCETCNLAKKNRILNNKNAK